MKHGGLAALDQRIAISYQMPTCSPPQASTTTSADSTAPLDPERTARRAISQLNQLGYTVTLNPLDPAA